MIAIDNSGKLDSFCSQINGVSSSYLSDIQQDISKLVEAFNTYWISNDSKDFANEISDSISVLVREISNIFVGLDDGIKSDVQKFNITEHQDVVYPGFTFAIPSILMDINKTLPNGKVGVADNVDLNTIKESISDRVERLMSDITKNLDEIDIIAKRSDVFDVNAQQRLIYSIQEMKNKIENSKVDLKIKILTKLNKEISNREKLNKTIIERIKNNATGIANGINEVLTQSKQDESKDSNSEKSLEMYKKKILENQIKQDAEKIFGSTDLNNSPERQNLPHYLNDEPKMQKLGDIDANVNKIEF